MVEAGPRERPAACRHPQFRWGQCLHRPAGFGDTHRTAEHVAELLGCGGGEVAVASTGLIGEFLPMDKLLFGVDRAVKELSADGGADAAEAIRTTDTVAKQAVAVSDSGFTVGGMIKGAGMLAPGLATMLCVLTTDAVADAGTLDTALREATRTTLERIDSDGCMSTNDTVLLLASGASGVQAQPGDLLAAVHQVLADLGKQLIADAEGVDQACLHRGEERRQ